VKILKGNKQSPSYEKITLEIPKRFHLPAMKQLNNFLIQEEITETQSFQKRIREAAPPQRKLWQNAHTQIIQDVKRLTNKLTKTKNVEFGKLLREVIDIKNDLEACLNETASNEEIRLRNLLKDFMTDKKRLDEKEKVEKTINELEKKT